MVKFITKGVEELSPEHPCSFEELVHHNRQTDSESGVCLKTIIEENVPLCQIEINANCSFIPLGMGNTKASVHLW